jgi:hypothetical protein
MMRKILVIIALLLIATFVYTQEVYTFKDLGATFSIVDFGVPRTDMSSYDIAELARSIVSDSPYRWKLENSSNMQTVISIISSRFQTNGRFYFAVIEFHAIRQIYTGVIYYPRNKNPICTFYSRIM